MEPVLPIATLCYMELVEHRDDSRSEALDVLRPFFSYSECVYQCEEPELRHVCRCVNQVAVERAEAVVRSAYTAGAPIMMIHQSDGFACNMMQTVKTPLLQKTLSRVGCYRQEWLLELQIVKTIDVGGRFEQAIRYFAPRAVVGKTGWHIFHSSLHRPTLMQWPGCEHIIKIDVFVQDGLHAAGMVKKQGALRSLFYGEVWHVNKLCLMKVVGAMYGVR